MRPWDLSNSGAGAAAREGDNALRAFLSRLRARYEFVCAAPCGSLSRDACELRAGQLLLAEAALRFADPADGQPRPAQLAVLGPTQVGKSTVVNLLLGSRCAAVSPLAGFTVHPQGFWLDGRSTGEEWTLDLLPGWTRCDPSQLERERLMAWGLRRCPGGPENGPLSDCIVWDTPDFDSLAAHSYRQGVLEIAALADAIVLVVSKEKYADLSVWKMLDLLLPLGRPLVVCLNKTTPDATEALTRSLSDRFAQLSSSLQSVPIFPLPYDAEIARGGETGGPATQALRSLARDALAAGRSSSRARGALRLIGSKWEEWTAPLNAEHAVVKQWTLLVGAALEQGLAGYRRDFLEHPQRYDTFRRATVELLHLLELPVVGGSLARVRQVVTWPARQLLAAGRSLFQRIFDSEMPHGLGSERRVLRDVIAQIVVGLRRDAGRRGESTDASPAWRALGRRLDERETELTAAFEAAVTRHEQQNEREIQDVAHQLFEGLQQRPALLNTLRAARVTTDLASIALAIKTGGAHVNDLLLAPAMFAVVSLLTEGALGTHMSRLAQQLKERQLARVKSELFEKLLRGSLDGLACELEGPGVLGITPAELQAAASLRLQQEALHAQ